MENHGLETSFVQLILGFSSAALYYLGHGDLEGQKKVEINPNLARHNIEIIRLLEEKTKGNLTSDEADLIKKVLADLDKKIADL